MVCINIAKAGRPIACTVNDYMFLDVPSVPGFGMVPASALRNKQAEAGQ